ncbi:helicase C-terminal domain-domain-containing protein [Lobosporangium transversale]|uniref:ATP-dependent DNA helicase CHL1 n=1 Tax=Lobosporangium transversale TaxID=64571 RepID=A0A1Y2GCR6_9FUNG|nr:helicase C-terminal domain-domain-containing protein [Lobosporangium transversale]ORZ07234.1 helicase C-terminal domain-domain-containing protein [Lobosporangium transversale]|eukprot:XP_021877897.1 helicase C-terminal domain-domain-containing protein [Lobosporangium transversale]
MHIKELSCNTGIEFGSEKEKEEGKNEELKNEEPLPIPASFPAFPYATPYSIQTQFMQGLFECVDRRKVGIFESPTGTGKSLSMICGAVGWLIEYERAEQEKIKKEQEEQGQANAVQFTEKNQDQSCSTSTTKVKQSFDDDTPDWVQQHRTISRAAVEREDRETRRAAQEARVQKIRDREKKMRENMARKMKRQAGGMDSIGDIGYRSVKKKKEQGLYEDDFDDAEFLVDDYESDEDKRERGGRKGNNGNFGNISKEVLELLKSFEEKEVAHGGKNSRRALDDEDEIPDVLKIYYCSRTHSQLSQFIGELRKTSYGEHLHVITLGSRKTLCINDRFRQKASFKSSRASEPIINVNKLNDVCLDAQKAGTTSEHRCEFLQLPSSNFGNKVRRGVSDGNNSDGGDGDSSHVWRKSNISMDSDEKLLQFSDHTLARIRDIEELAELGSELETCPYYGSRQTVRQCQLVTLPYNLLLHASTRESLKLVIKDNVLLLDEAHNLINSLLQMHSVTLSLQQIILAQQQLHVYLTRYEKRLSSTNEGYIRILLRILKCLDGFLEKWKSGTSTAKQPQEAQSIGRTFRPTDKVMKVNEFLHEAGMDHINLFKAHAYLETSGVARKLQGLHESLLRKEAKRQSNDGERATVKIHSNSRVPSKSGANQPSRPDLSISTTPILHTVDSFLMSLLNADNDGRVIVSMEEDNGGTEDESDDTIQGSSMGRSEPTLGRNWRPVLKFMLLNPANVFKPLVDEARSVVLAGGTMEPVSDLLSHLFPYLKDKTRGTNGGNDPHSMESLYPRIYRFSCGHVIPQQNLMTLIVEKAPNGGSLELNFANRTLEQVIDAIGQSLVNVLNIIPDGVVVFFVSYSYMARVLSRWQTKDNTISSTTAKPSIMDRIQSRKRVFVEPREAGEADRILRQYQECIREKPEHGPVITGDSAGPHGAVLFSVVGGKMSEGINFSDRLGRGVIMIGMPFPNKSSAELQERMRYMDQVEQLELQQNLKGSSSLQSLSPSRMTAGNEYYENLCMRAVNQSIGRAIRHQNDYAVIVLMDKRYGVARIRKKLPGWIGSSIETCEQFGPVMSKLSGFFRAKRENALK